jgi:hypothetical protein
MTRQHIPDHLAGKRDQSKTQFCMPGILSAWSRCALVSTCGRMGCSPQRWLVAEPTYEELKAKLAELESKQQRTGSMQFKVSDKGGVSVYGLGRFPVTLYYEQWMRLLDKAGELREFLQANKEKLKLKEQQ